MIGKWDLRFLEMAKLVASWSKDPSTKCGCVIVDPSDNSLISIGYNGLAPGVEDTEERYTNRDIKYEMVIHCETNSLLQAQRSVKGFTIYLWPLTSCSRCAAQLIKAGIKRVVFPATIDEARSNRWNMGLTYQQFEEAKIMVCPIAFD